MTLGIIGVVSAMTVPTLMQNYQRKSYVTQLHKVYNELSQAALQYITDKNAVDLKEAGLIVTNNNTTAFENFIKIILKWFKIVKILLLHVLRLLIKRYLVLLSILCVQKIVWLFLVVHL